MQTAGERLRIDTQQFCGLVLLAITGEVDPATTPAFGPAVEQGIGQAGKVVLDFTGDTFMDSSGLNVLVATARQGPDDDAVVIRNAPLSVNRLLTITGLKQVIQIEGDLIDSRRAAS